MSKSIKGLIPVSSKSDKQRDADMQLLQKFDIEITKAKNSAYPSAAARSLMSVLLPGGSGGKELQNQAIIQARERYNTLLAVRERFGELLQKEYGE